MRNLLFDTPWWLLAGLAVVAATLLVSGNNRQDKNLKRGGLFFLGLLFPGVGQGMATHTPAREVSEARGELRGVSIHGGTSAA